MHKLVLQGIIESNCYIIDHHKKCYIVDPGSEKDKIIQYVESQGLEVLGILLTHAHLDHIGAIDCFDVPIYLHEKAYPILCDDALNCFSLFGTAAPFDIKDLNIVTINEDTTLPLGDKIIHVIYTPGHTIGGVCYQVDNDLYTGDTLFQYSVGKWTFPTGDLAQLKASVADLIEHQDGAMRIHPGHGDSSTIAAERQYNSFYATWKNGDQFYD